MWRLDENEDNDDVDAESNVYANTMKVFANQYMGPDSKIRASFANATF